MHGSSGSWLQTLLPLLIIGVVMALRLRSAGRERPLKLAMLWVVPLLYVLLCGVVLATAPPGGIGWLLFAVALLMGGLLGWQRGRMMGIRVDEATGTVWQKSSPAAVFMLIAIVVLRRVAMQAFPADPHAGGAALMVTDALLGFALGLLSLTRLEMGLRARRLLAEHARPA
ncbi:DUF1453 family protein [Sphingomonas ginkgonis]|uniref:DUF1453 family protein n=1 Tax=Sphingomonas ginkgonis TaxID=2315330 RepID=A0A3R9Z5X3_9SPHN|nr:CcdC protein domain-containing protein [Sphingomonas ginkgonis]RST30513.1 DUF1453 family protein [Sphingomonas ginkgonis]